MKRFLPLVTLTFFWISGQGQWLGNDDCATAVPLTVNAACISGDNSGATIAGDYSMSCGFGGDPTDAACWFSFVAPASGSVIISTDHAGTNFDTQINLLGAAAGDPTMCPGTMFEYGCDEDGGAAAGGLSSTMQVGGLTAGQTYWIQLDGYAGAVGNYCIDVVEVVCGADVGTFTINATGGNTMVVGNTIYACENTVSCFEVLSNNDYTLPSGFPSGPPACTTVPELMYAIYINLPPTTGNPDTDPNWAASGSLFWTGQDFSDCNPSAYPPTINPGDDIYLVPVTVDDGDDDGGCGGLQIDGDGDGCFDVGATITVHYLNDVTFTSTETSCAGTVDITVSGGSPEVTGNDYTITNTGAGILTGTPISHGGTVTITGLTNGDNYSIQVTDPLGCVHTFNGGPFAGDVTNPIITCPANQSVNVDASTCGAAVTIPVPATSDNCSVASVTNDFNGTGDASDTYPVGTTTVTWTVTDAIGNTATCSHTITVTDNENPTITCPADVSQGNDAGVCNAAVTIPAPATADNCAVASVTNDFNGTGDASDTYPVGTTVVTWTVTDVNGNSNTCTQNVTINDTENPTITCPANQNVNFDANCEYALVDYTGMATTSDNCPAAVTVTQSPVVGTVITATQTVTLTATDGVGNTATCTFDVIPVDNTNPTITCPANQNVNFDANCEFTLVDYTGMATATDNCGPVTVTQSPVVGTVITGTQTVTLTATDGNSNTATCTFDVIPADNTPPNAVCQNISVNLDAAGNASIVGADVDNGSSDNCSAVTLSVAPNSFTCADVGANNVTLTVSDASGNSSTCNATVTVNDPNVPTASAGNDATICSVDTYTLSGLLGGTASAGTWTTSGDGTFSLATDPNAVYTPGATDISNGTVTLTWTTDPSPCATASDNMILTINPTPVPVAGTPVDPTGCGVCDGSITIGGLSASTTYDITYDDASGTVNLAGVTTDASGDYVITGLCSGSYNNFTATLNGCTGTDAGTISLSDPGSPTFTASFVSDPTSCGGSDGVIELCGLNASTTYDNLDYNDGTGVINYGSFTTDATGCFQLTGLSAASYTGFVVTLSGCTGNDPGPVVLSDPSAPVFTASSVSDPTSCGGADGVIEICGLNASTTYDNLDYDDGTGTVSFGSFTTDATGCFQITGLSADSYSNFAVTLAGCTGTDAGPVVLSDPSAPVFTASMVSNPTACGAVDGIIEICGLNASTTYDSVFYDNTSGTVNLGSITTDATGCYQILGLTADSYSNFVVWLTGCSGTDAGPVVLSDPGSPSFTASLVSDPTSCGAADGVIEICGLNASTTYDSLVYNDGSGSVNAGSFTTDATGCYQITGLVAGSYTNFAVWLTGCSGLDAGPITLTDPNAPTFTASLSSDPTTCGGADGVIEICGLNASTTYDNLDYDDASGTVTVGTFTTDAAGCYQITGLTAGSYSNFVVILSGCTGTDAGPVTLTDPGAPAAPTAGTDGTHCEGDPIPDMTATSSAGGTLTWYNDAGLTNVVGTGANMSPSTALGTVTYYVTETASGCEGPPSTVTITVENCVNLELTIPTGFTPDGDGDNDVWELENINALYPDNTVRVYNRWGNMLYESVGGYTDPWDGTYNGKDLPIGSYYFVIEFGDDTMDPEKGSVTIIR